MPRFSVADMNRSWKASLAEEGKLTDAGDGVSYAVGEPNARGYVALTIWAGTRAKPVFNFLVKPEKVAGFVAIEVEKAKSVAGIKASRAAEKAESSAKMREKIVPGMILHGSWGYDQTNCELYEVTARPTPATAIIRELAAEIVPGSEGFMSCSLKPIPGKYVGPELKVRIGAYGIRLSDHCTLFPTTADATHYSSWYA